MGRNRVLGAPFEVQTATESFTTEFQFDMYAVDAAIGSPVTVTLDPNAFNGDQVLIQDVAGNASVQPIVVLASAGQVILNGFGASLSLSTDGGAVQLTFDQVLGGWVPQQTSAAAAAPAGLNITVPTTVILDPLHGSDASAAGPFKTVVRLNQYLTNAQVSAQLTIKIGFGYLATDALFAPQGVQLLNAGFIVIEPLSQTVVHSGTLTAGTMAINPATQQRETLEDTALGGGGWAPYALMRVVDETGPNSGTGCFVMNVIAADKAQCTQPCTPSGTYGAMVSGDAYSVIENPTLGMGFLDIVWNTPNGPLNGVTVEDLTITGFPVAVDNNVIYLFQRCAFASTFVFSSPAATQPNLIDCLTGLPPSFSAFAGFGPVTVLFGGAILSGGEESTQLTLGGNLYATGVQLSNQAPSGFTAIDEVGVPGNGLQVQDTTGGGAAVFATVLFSSAVALLWGTGNAGFGLAVLAGTKAIVSSTPVNTPTITGALGDIGMEVISGALVTTAFPWNPAAASYVAPAIALTWASFVAAPFNFNAHQPQTEAHLLGVPS